MLCPVVESGARSRRIVLPEGVWHDFWSSQSWQGPGEIEYPAPLDCLPLLVRGGTVLPMGPVLQHIPDGYRFDKLDLHIWPPYPAEGWLYKDDGGTTAYQQGAYSLARLTAEGDDDQISVRISTAGGDFPTQADSRYVEIVVHSFPTPRAVLLNG